MRTAPRRLLTALALPPPHRLFHGERRGVHRSRSPTSTHFTTPAERGRPTPLEADFVTAGRATHRRANVRWTARAVVPLPSVMTAVAARLAGGQNRATRGASHQVLVRSVTRGRDRPGVAPYP